MNNDKRPASSLDKISTLSKIFESLGNRKKYINNLNIIYLNIRSLRKNFELFVAELAALQEIIDIIILVETNICEEENGLFNIPNYVGIFQNRKEKRGGGIAMFMKNNIKFNIMNQDSQNFECLMMEVEKNDEKILIMGIYRPPNTYNTSLFTSELGDIFSKYRTKRDIVLVGDVNLDILKDTRFTSEYFDMMSENGFQNENPYEITREDLNRNTFTNIDHIFVKQGNVESVETFLIKTLISDHFSIFCSLQLKHNNMTRNFQQVFRIKNKIVDSLIQQTSWTYFEEEKNVVELFQRFHSLFDSIYEAATEKN